MQQGNEEEGQAQVALEFTKRVMLAADELKIPHGQIIQALLDMVGFMLPPCMDDEELRDFMRVVHMRIHAIVYNDIEQFNKKMQNLHKGV